MTNIELSKFLSYVLRHRPDSIGITLDKEGWSDIVDLMVKAEQHGKSFTVAQLREVVETNDKKRFTFSENKKEIRAAQGHSTNKVSMKLVAKSPPPVLYHGTGSKSVQAINKDGLLPMNRHHVHLSADRETAVSVGSRHGKAHVFEVDTYSMVKEGHKFYQSDNGVWLIDAVPTKFLK